MLEALSTQGGLCGDWSDVMRYLKEGVLKDENCIVTGI